MTIAVTDTAEFVLRSMVTLLRENIGGGVAAIDSYINALDTSAGLELKGFGTADAAGEGTRVYIGEDPALDVQWPNIGLRLVDVSAIPDEVGGFYELVEEYEALIGVREDCVTSGTSLVTPPQVYRALLIYAQALANCVQDRLRADLASDGVGRCDWLSTTPIADGFGEVLGYGASWTVRFCTVRLQVKRTYIMSEA